MDPVGFDPLIRIRRHAGVSQHGMTFHTRNRLPCISQRPCIGSARAVWAPLWRAVLGVLLLSGLSVSSELCNLNGNWTSSTHAGSDVVHIEFFQSPQNASFTLRATPWGSALSYGRVLTETTVQVGTLAVRQAPAVCITTRRCIEWFGVCGCVVCPRGAREEKIG